MNDHKTAIKMAGKRFATLIFLSLRKLRPIQKIKIEPPNDKLSRAAIDMNGPMISAKTVNNPWNIATEIAEKIQPFPFDALIIAMNIASSIPLARRIV